MGFIAKPSVSGGAKPVLLWENPNKDSAVGSFSVDVPDLSEYNYIAVYVKASYNEGMDAPGNNYSIVKISKRNEINAFLIGAMASTAAWVCRLMTITSNVSISFTTSQQGSSRPNEWAIPIYIYGIKNIDFT